MRGSRRGGPIPTSARLFFSIPNLVPFEKLNEVDEKILRTTPFTFYFIFYFLFLFFIVLKLICFIKNKNIMNFYKLFIKKHYYYYYLY